MGIENMTPIQNKVWSIRNRSVLNNK